MASNQNSKSKGKNKSKKDKNSEKLSFSSDGNEKNGHHVSADYDEISTVYSSESIVDNEKAEAFRRIASAEESEEIGIRLVECQCVDRVIFIIKLSLHMKFI